MTRIEKIRYEVATLYGQKTPTRAEWADWMYDHHVLVVASYAVKLAKKYHYDAELSEVAALLHDCADAFMSRSDTAHEEASLQKARDLMKQCEFNEDEIKLVVDDAIRYHSCHGDVRPESRVGLVLATADSLAHLKTDFYIYATRAFDNNQSLDEVKKWVLEKIGRDLNHKIQFDDERTDCQADYDAIKRLFSR